MVSKQRQRQLVLLLGLVYNSLRMYEIMLLEDFWKLKIRVWTVMYGFASCLLIPGSSFAFICLCYLKSAIMKTGMKVNFLWLKHALLCSICGWVIFFKKITVCSCVFLSVGCCFFTIFSVHLSLNISFGLQLLSSSNSGILELDSLFFALGSWLSKQLSFGRWFFFWYQLHSSVVQHSFVFGHIGHNLGNNCVFMTGLGLCKDYLFALRC